MPWRALARRFPVLAIGDFRLLFSERLLAMSSVGFSLVGVSFAVLNATGSPADLSYVLAAQIAPTLGFAVIGGVLADRFTPQAVLVAANLAIVAGEGGFGLLVLTAHPPLWAMIALEALTGTGTAMIYPASQALLPRVVPEALLQEASSISRMGMNSGQMAGAALSGLVVAAVGPGWALALSGACVAWTVPLLLRIKSQAETAARGQRPSMIRELREGWAEFRSHTWLWATVIQYCLVMMAWNGAFSVLGPVVARQRLGGPAAWGAITASEGVGLLLGGVLSLRWAPRRPMLLVVGAGGALALSPLALGLAMPLPVICVVVLGLGALMEVMMVQWTVAMATRIAPGKLARVASYDALGSMAAMPLGALIAGPLASSIGVPGAEFAAAAVMAGVSALTLIPRDIRLDQAGGSAPVAQGQRAAAEDGADGEGAARLHDRRDRQDLIDEELLVAGEVRDGRLHEEVILP
jgi:predicted MFS family arabinose efflux permease